MKKFKKNSRRVQRATKQYWGKHFWEIGYGVWSVENVSEEIVQEYLEHHRNPSNRDTKTMILE